MNGNATVFERVTALKKKSIPKATRKLAAETPLDASTMEGRGSVIVKVIGILRTALTALVLAALVASIAASGPFVQEAHAATLKGAILTVTPTYSPANGEYCIGIYGTSKVLDVQSASLADKGNVWIYDANDTAAQRFVITKVSGKWYQIVNKNSGKALSVAGGKKANNVNIWQYKNNRAKSQLWCFRSVNGYTVIENQLGYVLSVDGSISQSKSNVTQKSYSGSNAQKWKLIKKNDAAVKIAKSKIQLASALDGNKVIDMCDGNLENGGNAQIWGNGGSTNQKFVLGAASGYYYTMKFGVSNKLMDVKGGSKAENANVQQYVSNGTDAQMWKFIPCGDGYYYVQSKLGKYLTLASNSATNGSTVCLHSKLSTNQGRQKWKIVSTTLGDNTYYNKMIKFIKDPRWKNHIGWGYYQKSKLNKNSGTIGCAAYCYDWVKYMYGHNGLTTGAKKYTSANDIKTGCIVHWKYNDNDQHWFVVVSRDGNKIHSIEGNAAGMTRDSTSVYKIKNGVLYAGNRVIDNKHLYVYDHGKHYKMN